MQKGAHCNRKNSCCSWDTTDLGTRNSVDSSPAPPPFHTALLHRHCRSSMSSYTTKTNTYVILKYSRSWPDLNNTQKSEWEHVNSPRLRIRLSIVGPSNPAGGQPRYCLKVLDDLSSSRTIQLSQTSSENVWEDMDLTSFSELRAPYPVAGTPLRAVYREKAVAFRYLFPCGGGPSQNAEAVHRRFQVHFASSDDAAAFIQSIRNVCPCLEKQDQQQPVTATSSSSSSTLASLPSFALPGLQKRKFSELNTTISSSSTTNDTGIPSSMTWDSLPVNSKGRAEDSCPRSQDPAIHQNTIDPNHKRSRIQAPPLITVTSATSPALNPSFQMPDWRMLQVPDLCSRSGNEMPQDNAVVERANATIYHHLTESTSDSSSLYSSPTPIGLITARTLALGNRTDSFNALPPLRQHSQPRQTIYRNPLVYPAPTSSSGGLQMDSLPPSTPPEAIISSGCSSPTNTGVPQLSLDWIGMSDLELKSMLFELVNDPGFEAMMTRVDNVLRTGGGM